MYQSPGAVNDGTRLGLRLAMKLAVINLNSKAKQIPPSSHDDVVDRVVRSKVGFRTHDVSRGSDRGLPRPGHTKGRKKEKTHRDGLCLWSRYADVEAQQKCGLL